MGEVGNGMACLKTRVIILTVIFLAFIGGGCYAAYAFKNASISVNEVNQYFMSSPEKMDLSLFLVNLWGHSKILMIVWTIGLLEILKQLNVLIIGGYAFAYGFTMTTVVASMPVNKGIGVLFALVIQGIVMIIYFIDFYEMTLRAEALTKKVFLSKIAYGIILSAVVTGIEMICC